MNRFVAFLFFAGLVVSQQQGAISHPVEHVAYTIPLGVAWQDGDIVLREGKGAISSFMRSTSSREKRFSHAGILLNTTNGPRVFHVIGTPENPQGGLVADLPEEFCNPRMNKSFMVVRFPFSPEHIFSLRQSVNASFRNEVTFDKDFDLQTDQAYYCTEFIYKMIQKSTGNANWIPVTRTNKGLYVGLDDIYLNASAKKIVDQNF